MNITGRLTRDAEVCTTSQLKQVVNFSVAINDSYRNKQGERIEQRTLVFAACRYCGAVRMVTAHYLLPAESR